MENLQTGHQNKNFVLQLVVYQILFYSIKRHLRGYMKSCVLINLIHINSVNIRLLDFVIRLFYNKYIAANPPKGQSDA